MKPNAPSVLERSIYWQRHVAANTKDPRQKARALAAVDKLTEELNASKGMERAENQKKEMNK